MKNIPTLLQASVAEEYSLALTESGENYLHFAIAEATLGKLISVELKELRVIMRMVTAVEADLNHAFGIESSPFATVRLHGKADRIDLEGEVVVTDYKTGSVKDPELALKGDWLERLAQGKSSKALQSIYSAIALKHWATVGLWRPSSPAFVRAKMRAKACSNWKSTAATASRGRMPVSRWVGWWSNSKHCTARSMGLNTKLKRDFVRIVRYWTPYLTLTDQWASSQNNRDMRPRSRRGHGRRCLEQHGGPPPAFDGNEAIWGWCAS